MNQLKNKKKRILKLKIHRLMYIGNIKGIADFLGKGIDDINQHLSFNQFKVGSIKHRNA